MTDEKRVPGPDQDEANQTEGNQRDKEGNLVTPPAPSGDDSGDTGTGGDTAPAVTDPSVNPTTPPPAEQP